VLLLLTPNIFVFILLLVLGFRCLFILPVCMCVCLVVCIVSLFIALLKKISISPPSHQFEQGLIYGLAHISNCNDVNVCYPSGAPQFTPSFSGVRVTRSLVSCVLFCRSLFVLFYLAIVLSNSDYPFGIFKLFLSQ